MKKILIAEDEQGLLDVLKNRFMEDNWDVVAVNNGEAAIEAIKKEKFKLIILDLLMPKKNGFEVLEEIKSNPDYKDLPIIVLSSLGQDEDIKKAMKLGASSHFIKVQNSIAEILEKANTFE